MVAVQVMGTNFARAAVLFLGVRLQPVTLEMEQRGIFKRGTASGCRGIKEGPILLILVSPQSGSST